MRRRRQVLAAAAALLAQQPKPSARPAPERPRPAARPVAPQPRLVERTVERVEREPAPDLTGPLAAVDKRSRKAQEAAAQVAEQFSAVVAEVDERLQQIHGAVEQLAQQVSVPPPQPPAPSPAPPAMPAYYDGPTREEVQQAIQASTEVVAERFRALASSLEQLVAGASRAAEEAAAKASRAQTVAAQAMSRDIPQPQPLPDFLVGLTVSNGRLFGTFQSGVRKDFGALPKPRMPGGGRASSAQVAQWSAGAAGAWGDITGTLSDQVDLQAALDAKEDDGTAAAAVAAHEGAANPHPGYLTPVEGDAAYSALSHSHLRADLPAAVAYEDEANAFTESQSASKSTNGNLLFSAANANAGNVALAGFQATNDGSTGYLNLLALGTGFTTSGSFRQDGAVIESGAGLSGGLSITARTGGLRIYVGGTSDANNMILNFSSATLGTLREAFDLAFGTSTGSKIGTSASQKIGKWGVTPVVQPAGASQAAVATTAATNVAPYGFTTQAQADAIVTLLNAIRSALVATGEIKGAA